MDGSSENDWLLKLAALQEQDEYLTELLCERLNDASQSVRQYLEQQEMRLQQLKQHLPNDAEAVRYEVDWIYRDVAERLKEPAAAIESN